MDEFIEWRVPPAPAADGSSSDSSGGGNGTVPVALPELWTRWEYFDMPDDKLRGAAGLQPRKHGPPQRVPLVHWHWVAASRLATACSRSSLCSAALSLISIDSCITLVTAGHPPGGLESSQSVNVCTSSAQFLIDSIRLPVT